MFYIGNSKSNEMFSANKEIDRDCRAKVLRPYLYLLHKTC